MIVRMKQKNMTDESDMICGCFDFTIADIHRTLDENPDLKFQEFLDFAKIGNKCTACLLDLEYHFVDHSTHKKTAPKKTIPAKVSKNTSSQKSLKQRLYSFLDALTPNVPYPFDNPMPVLYGPDVEQWVQIVNRSMLFDKKSYAPDIDVSLVLRDNSGRVVHTVNETLEKDGLLRTNLSELLAKAAPLEESQEIGIGWVSIQRKGKVPGIRGTTRPQVEIITSSGACAVHSQADSPPSTKGFSALCRPRDERLFLSFINTGKKVLNVKLSYPYFMDQQNDETQAQEKDLTIPPFSVVLHEVNLEKFIDTEFENRLMGLRWTSSSSFKAHVFCATKSLDRFSIDHV